jgi:N-methylhydantoinase B
MPTKAPEYDVIAAEVHRKAIENLTNEMAITLMRTSGSPVVVEVRDFSTCLMDTEPEHLGFAAYVTAHLGSSLVGVRKVAELAAASGDVRPGDGWLVNDPHTGGALHQGDVGVIMPTFCAGELMGWSFANMHVLDVGGTGISGYAPGARDLFAEGLRFPPLRIIREGAIESTWEEFIGANVRVPGPVLNDLRSLIATNNTAARKLDQIVDEFGVERHREFCRVNKDLTEELLRERIAAIPDGVYEAVDWDEFDGHEGPDQLLEMRLRLEVDGSELRFAYSGVPQIDAFVNSTEGAMLGTTFAGLVPMLAYGDLPVNGGIFRPVSVDLGAPGTIVNATEPAAVSNAHSEVGARATKLTRDVLNNALARSEDPVLRGRVSGQGQESYPGVAFFTENQHGGQSVLFYIDTATGNGGPAQTVADGIETYGYSNMTGCGLPDVETHEAVDPLLVLWRRLIPDSGGPGRMRGGLGLEQAFALRYSDLAAGPAFNACAEVPPRGYGGGMPGAAGDFYLLAEANLAARIAAGESLREEGLEGERPALRSKVERAVMRRDDVFVMRSGSGGGIGDPLLREPELVARDVADGYLTPAHADTVYGVIASGRGLDEAATAERRAELRRERIGREPSASASPPESVGVAVERGGEGWSCACCGNGLGAGPDWRGHAGVVRRDALAADRFAERGMQVKRRTEAPDVLLREYFCGACAAALSTEVVVASDR